MKSCVNLAVATAIGAAAFGTAAFSSSAASAADAAKGKALFMSVGCYHCHGTQGQGMNTGPKLAPDPMPVEALTAFIRNAGTTAMPAFSAKMVSDAEVADIHAYLASIPKAADWKTVPLLNNP
jgi:ubiquinol-cytochrome c reductase cytochrome c subunit